MKAGVSCNVPGRERLLGLSSVFSIRDKGGYCLFVLRGVCLFIGFGGFFIFFFFFLLFLAAWPAL